MSAHDHGAAGQFTFLFTDIEGSTTRWERHGEAMQEAVGRHDALVRHAIEHHSGEIFKTVGDAFCAVFTHPDDAVDAALEAQHSLVISDFSIVDGLRVRMALHAGPAQERDGDYFGPTLNRVARLLSTAHGGQIVLSNKVAQAVRQELPTNVSLRDLGDHRLKDLTEPEHIFQLIAPDLTADFPPLISLTVLSSNLPQQLTPLIGRERELAAVKALISEHRLVTITGAGGVGKTRAAIQVAADLVEHFTDGAFFVDLARLGNATSIATEIGSALGAHGSSTRGALGSVVDFLRRRRVLLVVDNCEHAVDKAAEVLHVVMSACSDVKVLATSREPLQLSGERVYLMPALALPERTEHLGAAEALGGEAVQLFVERAKAADASFELTDEAASIVADIVHRLDGIPLAIELAAARVGALSVSQILQLLDQRFRILTSSGRGTVPHHRTMRALIDWSYDLLGREEQTLFRRLSIFAGGFTLEAAQAVCSDEGLEEYNVLDLVLSLVNKSLISADVGAVSARYRMLETTSEYSREKLAAAAEETALAERHARWVTSFADQAGEGGWATPIQVWLSQMVPEYDNIRAALSWSLGADGEPKFAGQIAGATARFWYEGDRQAEGRFWIESSLARLDERCEPMVAVRLYIALSNVCGAHEAVKAAQKAITLAEKIGAPQQEAFSYVQLAFGHWQTGDYDAAAVAVDRALKLHHDSGMTDAWTYANALDAKAYILFNQEKLDEARRLFEAALNRYSELRDEHGVARVQANLAELEFASGDVQRALARAAEAASTFRRLNATSREAAVLVNIAAYELAIGDVAEANRNASNGLRLARRAQEGQLSSLAIQYLAIVAAQRHDYERSVRLLSFADARLRNDGYEREWNDRHSRDKLWDTLTAALPSAELVRLKASGERLTEEEAANLGSLM